MWWTDNLYLRQKLILHKKKKNLEIKFKLFDTENFRKLLQEVHCQAAKTIQTRKLNGKIRVKIKKKIAFTSRSELRAQRQIH